ncbi:DUF4391 domain-containing protein [Thiothrix winogradskyi]|uniref:DUF4391 domain-containing protein n=1 Tax=Thiothrix winogradskyi TaxID=96472 RepID=A0ABY3T4Q1_9GAMM|nr:DUF4391 domain-containing protein [Thiothrix winogradskyi]UJS26536.1 DUF4391 domain-containing protein [Thiothrix winogradskyi]
MLRVIGLDAFLDQHPFMSLVPQVKTEATLLEGKLHFHWTHDDQYEVKGFYELKITIPAAYPTTLSLVEEIGGQIPRNGDFHINEDGSFCLGSTLRLQLALRESADFNTFSEKFLIPFLYALSVKQQYGIDFIFGQLPHGSEGELLDYRDILGVNTYEQVVKALELLALRKRVANKRQCPCLCGHLLGKCRFHLTLNGLRKTLSRQQFRTLHKRLNAEVMSNSPPYKTLNLPAATRQSVRINKKQLLENADLSATDRKHIQQDIDTLEWRHVLKAGTCDIPCYQDEERDYSELHLIHVVLKSPAHVKRLGEVLQHAIQYPLLLVFEYAGQICLQMADKRINHADTARLMVETIHDSGWLNVTEPDTATQGLLQALRFDVCDQQHLYAFWQCLIDKLAD